VKVVQATVRAWEPGVGGSALTDQGDVLELPAACLEQGPFRFVRSGQRIAVELEDEHVLRVRLP
jgi:hypothetical protein